MIPLRSHLLALAIVLLFPLTLQAWGSEDGKSCYTAQSVTLNYEGEVQTFQQSGASSSTGNAYLDTLIAFFNSLFPWGGSAEDSASWYRFTAPTDGPLYLYTTDATVDVNAILLDNDCDANTVLAEDAGPANDANLSYTAVAGQTYKLGIYHHNDGSDGPGEPTFRPFIVMELEW